MKSNVILLVLLEVLIHVRAQNNTVVYDAYFGTPITARRSKFLAGVVNASIECTVAVRPCREDEGRRVDGTCTNPHYPSRGASFTPFPRLLPPRFGQGNTLPPANDGSDLPSARLIRTSILGDGFFKDRTFTVLATHFITFTVIDYVDFFYILRYVLASDCCLGNRPNLINPMCISIPVRGDDPYLRESRVRCLNLTRTETYQDHGCLPRTLPPERYSRNTPMLDLSTVYGNTEERSRLIRANKGGLLSFRMEGNREVPSGQSIFCIGNQPPEVACYNFGEDYGANIIGATLLNAMWFFREHNRLARRLAELNPCWDDEKLFQTARQINIAQYQYLYYYELIPEYIGRKNALAEGIIYDETGYVNDFDYKYEPGVYREFTVGMRWFHNHLDAMNELYRDGKYVGSRPVSSDFVRSGIYPINNTEADLTQGSYMQPAARFDYILDAQMTHRYGANLLSVADLGATDIMRGRDAGFQSYNNYRKFCGLPEAKEWEDLHDTIDVDKLERLRRLYDNVDDIELIVAIYAEKWLPDAYVGPTLYCFMVQNLLMWRKSDKFFFEHGGFPAALTLPQLTEIRKTSMSRILCDSGDQVKHIQPHSFFRISEWNHPIPCKEIPGMNLYHWKDESCLLEQPSTTPKIDAI